MIAARYDDGDRSDALFADLLWIRLGLRDQLQSSVARMVSRVGGVGFATDPEVAYLVGVSAPTRSTRPTCARRGPS